MATRSDWPRTRTWLPEGDRAPDIRKRRTGYLPAALLFALLAVGGLYLSVLGPDAGRGSPGDDGSTTDSESVAGDPQTGRGAGSAGSGVAAGVPVGYPRTEEGAQSAAANYLTTYGSEAMFGATSRADIVGAIVAESDRVRVAAQLDESFGLAGRAYGLDAEGTARPGLDFVARTVPVGTRVQSFGSGRAVVEVWAVGIVGVAGPDSTKPITQAWETATVTLRWSSGDWKWVSVTIADGPTPVSGLQPPSPGGRLAEAAAEFAGLHYGR